MTTAIIGTTNPQHAYGNLDLAAKGPLEAGTIDQLRSAFEKAADDSWTGQT